MRARPLLPAHHLTMATALTLLIGCEPVALDWPEVGDAGWATYSNAVAGYTLRYPAVCTTQEHAEGRSVIFRYDGEPILAVSWVDEEEGQRRGLWVRHEPIDTIALAGRQGSKYIYNHYDGPFGLRTVSYVIPHQERWLGVELRTAGSEPSATQQAILDSLSFG